MEDFGEMGGRSEKVADHALVFMVMGLLTKWKQSIGYFKVNTMRHPMLETMLLKALSLLQSIGLKIIGIICDEGSNNCCI